MSTATNKRTAKNLLTRYFETCFHLAGVSFDQDNRAEIGVIINAIFDEIAEAKAAAEPDPALAELRRLYHTGK